MTTFQVLRSRPIVIWTVMLLLTLAAGPARAIADEPTGGAPYNELAAGPPDQVFGGPLPPPSTINTYEQPGLIAPRDAVSRADFDALQKRLNDMEAEFKRLRGEQSDASKNKDDSGATTKTKSQSTSAAPEVSPLGAPGEPDNFGRNVDPMSGDELTPRDNVPDEYIPREVNFGGRPTVVPRGRIMGDTFNFSQSPSNKADFGDIPNGFAWRQARFGIRGVAYDNTFYQIEMDFVGGVAFKSTYFGFTNIPFLNTVMLGYFKMPFSLEEMPTEENIVFMERSTAGLAFVPGRKTGAKFMNHSNNLRSTYSMGMFYSDNSDGFGQSISNNLAESVAARVTYLPYYDENSGGRYYWHFGTSFLAGRPWQGQEKFNARPETDVYNTTDANGVPVNTVPNFVSTKSFAAQGNAVLDIENAVVWNSLTLQSEVMVAQTDRPVNDGPTVTFWGGYLQASYFLTGEYRPYDRYQGYLSRVYPNERFFTADIRKAGHRKICIGKGAWEVGSRISYINLNSHDIQGGTMTCYTASLSWNANPHTRFEWNYVHALVNSASFTGNTADIFLTRFIQSF